ncbi:MAG: T9SS type A sorting domain-containing protein [Flavobacteriales bacterium]|nr:T9SS type A sorting domain-containing protein [Flavobacteriales bacterium]
MEDQFESGGSLPYLAIANNVTAFGPFTLTPVLSPLPVELLGFTALAKGDAVELEWITASERNSDHFTVQRSSDGIRFDDVLRVNAAGNSQVLLRYNARDEQPFRGVSYYRLRQTDADGSTELSEVAAVRFDRSVGVSVFPNPASDRVHVMLDDLDASSMLELHDGTGRLVLRERLSNGRASFDVAMLPRGAYVLRSDDARIPAQRVIVH